MSQEDRLLWFIGFLEGSGIWCAKSLSVTVPQQSPKVLYKLKRVLRFGSVYKKTYKESRGLLSSHSNFYYKISGIKANKAFIDLINGKLFLDSSNSEFGSYIKRFNAALAKTDGGTIKHIRIRKMRHTPTQADAWISGFIDARGVFSAEVTESSFGKTQIKMRFLLHKAKEKRCLNDIAKIMGGNVLDTTSPRGNFRLVLKSKTDIQCIINYLKRFPLYSNRSVNFQQFIKLNVRLNDGKLEWRIQSKRARMRLLRLVDAINVRQYSDYF